MQQPVQDLEQARALKAAAETTLNLFVSGRRQAFDTYFASIVSMAQHPGTTRDAAQPMTLFEARDKAMAMLALRDELTRDGLL